MSEQQRQNWRDAVAANAASARRRQTAPRRPGIAAASQPGMVRLPPPARATLTRADVAQAALDAERAADGEPARKRRSGQRGGRRKREAQARDREAAATEGTEATGEHEHGE